MQDQPICECGCGEPAPLAIKTNTKRGWVRGAPLRFVHGHNSRGRDWHLKYRVTSGPLETPCWIWTRATDWKGYGHFTVGNTSVRAHRAMYEERYGPIPEGLVIDHLCRTPSCVNPDHLEPVTALENHRRGLLARLTEDDVRDIRANAQQGVTRKQQAARYGVTAAHIKAIVQRRCWKDIT
jgi:hypothetical protein